jgi:hypothetical protein
MTEFEIRKSERKAIKTLLELDLLVLSLTDPKKMLERVFQLIDSRTPEER